MAATQTTGKNLEERQLVVFDLGGEVYGVDINTVREIIRVQEITHVPNAPEFVEGVINLRGKVIPIVDLRKKFSLEEGEESKENRIVVVDIVGEDIGVMVDAVAEVMRLPSDSVEPTGDLIATDDSYYIEGIANLGERLIILLDLEKVLSKEQRTALKSANKVVAQAQEATPEAEETETAKAPKIARSSAKKGKGAVAS